MIEIPYLSLKQEIFFQKKLLYLFPKDRKNISGKFGQTCLNQGETHNIILIITYPKITQRTMLILQRHADHKLLDEYLDLALWPS